MTQHPLHEDIKLDLERPERIGFDEAVFCEGKAVSHIAAILDQARTAGGRLLLTRLLEAQYRELPEPHRAIIDYEPVSRSGYFQSAHPQRLVSPLIAVVAAGTSDIRVSREAARTLRYHGEPCIEISDVGVAGLWRLLERKDEISRMPVVIAVAGMDAALPTVLGGLVPSLIVGVPTSVGYGVAQGGHAALHAMLASCAPGLAVVNIDNGYGAACFALRAVRAIKRISPATAPSYA